AQQLSDKQSSMRCGSFASYAASAELLTGTSRKTATPPLGIGDTVRCDQATQHCDPSSVLDEVLARLEVEKVRAERAEAAHRAALEGYRHGTRDKYSKKYRTKGLPGLSRYLTTFKRGDYVDIVADSSVQKGLPYSFYHGRTGIVFNVNRNALGVEMTKIIGNRQLRKRIHVRIEHVRKSRCAESFLRRVKENDQKKRDARLQGKSIVCKRVPQGPKEMKIVKAVSHLFQQQC
ncbi:unnamed protein product, partial [Polarella glacialis]